MIANDFKFQKFVRSTNWINKLDQQLDQQISKILRKEGTAAMLHGMFDSTNVCEFGR